MTEKAENKTKTVVKKKRKAAEGDGFRNFLIDHKGAHIPLTSFSKLRL